MNERIDTLDSRLCQANGRVPIQARAKITKEALLAGAATCFNNHGYAGTSINDITAETSATKGALYFHFSSKTEVARHILDRWTQTVAGIVHAGISVPEVLRELATRAEQDPLARAAIILGVDPAATAARAGCQPWPHQLLRHAAPHEAGWAEYGSHQQRCTETLCAGFVGVVTIANSGGDTENICARVEDLLTVCQAGNVHHTAEEMAL